MMIGWVLCYFRWNGFGQRAKRTKLRNFLDRFQSNTLIRMLLGSESIVFKQFNARPHRPGSGGRQPRAGEEPSFILAREHAHSQQHSQTPLTLNPSPRLGGAREGARSRRWYSRVQAHGKRSLLPRLPPGEGSLRTATTLPASWRNGHCGFKRITRALVRISPNRIHLIMPAIHYSTVVMR
jgi:hypothetical protein